jgi:hypothetical protein
LILPNVSHFALLQDPEQFKETLLHFPSHPHAPDSEERAALERESNQHRYEITGRKFGQKLNEGAKSLK